LVCFVHTVKLSLSFVRVFRAPLQQVIDLPLVQEGHTWGMYSQDI
jgi:hypothetical protein